MLSLVVLFVIVVAPLLLLLPIFVLGFATALLRDKSGVALGFGNDPASLFARVGRAHGNATEYNPSLALLLVVAGLTVGIATPGWYMAIAWIFLIAATVALLARAASVFVLVRGLRSPAGWLRGLRIFSLAGTVAAAFVFMGLIIAALVSVLLMAGQPIA